jgi:hypothetical protein
VTLDYVAHSTGAYLDLELDDYAVASGETMQLDDISITKTGPGPALPLAQSPTLEGLSFAARLTPNPVHGTGDLLFSTTRGGAVKVEVFDVAGRLVSQPLDEAFVPAGHHGVTLTGADGGRRLGAGAYFYRLQAAEGSRIGKFVVVE